MGKKKKSSGHGHGVEEEQEHAEHKGSRAFVLKVAMHCTCHGCIDKIRAAVKDITLLQGIESWDQSALQTKGELKLVATTADPEKLRHRLHKATRKNVDLIFLPSKQANKEYGGGSSNNSKQAPGSGSDAAARALLLNSLLQQQGQYGQNQNAVLPAGAGWNTLGDYAYTPWAAQPQLPNPYATCYPYPPAGGGFAYPPAQGHGHGGAWHGLGY